VKKTLLFITTIFLTACSQKAVYDSMERASKSYEDYERERREVDES